MCQENIKSSIHVLSEQERKLIFFKRGIIVPADARCCREHLHNKQLKYESIQQISASQYDKLSLDTKDVQNIILDFRSMLTNSKTFDFDDPTSLSDESCFNFIGLRKGISFFINKKLIDFD